jgi:hypothetical protein
MRARVRIGLVALLLLLLGAIGLAGYARYGLLVQAVLAGSSPPVAPQGQRPFEVLDAGTFDHLRKVFNAGSDQTRVLALLSPT